MPRRSGRKLLLFPDIHAELVGVRAAWDVTPQVTPAAAVGLGLPDPGAKRLLVHARSRATCAIGRFDSNTSRTAPFTQLIGVLPRSRHRWSISFRQDSAWLRGLQKSTVLHYKLEKRRDTWPNHRLPARKCTWRLRHLTATYKHSQLARDSLLLSIVRLVRALSP